MTEFAQRQAHSPPPGVVILSSSKGRGWRGFEAEFCRLAAGKTKVAATLSHRVGVHIGPSVNADCRVDGLRLRRLQSDGDADVIPAGLDGEWEDDADCSILRIRIAPSFLREAAQGAGFDPDRIAISPRLQLRDARIQHVARALKAELESQTPTDRLYAESLGVALALRLLDEGARAALARQADAQTLSTAQQRRLLDYIESNLDQSLSLADLATVAKISVSHLKALFPRSIGLSVHQYVIRRRVERARRLIIANDLPMSQIALEAGFAHQSHMAMCMKRILGVTPRAIERLRAGG